MSATESLLQARPRRSRRIAARIWWATLPYDGWFAYPDLVPRPPLHAYPLAWLHRLVNRLDSSAPFEPAPQIVCDCDYCRGVPGAVFRP